MARLARVVVPGMPHHVLHRGNRKQDVFFNERDKQKYLDILTIQAELFELEVWAYCLMDNHVHLIVVPGDEESLAQAIGETHKLYTRMVNYREKWRGSLWEGRFKSMVMDEPYLRMALRYVERNPVRAGIVQKAEDYPWSSARCHIHRKSSRLLTNFYLVEEIDDWAEYLSIEDGQRQLSQIRCQSSNGRPLGNGTFLRELEQKLGRGLTKMKRGPKNRG